MDFWQALDKLVAGSALHIDRPRGTPHPRYPNFIYPLDYGYLEGTQSSDGQGIDVWVGSLPEKEVCGVILTVDLIKRDSEMKILLGCTDSEMNLIQSLHNAGNQSGLLVRREK